MALKVCVLGDAWRVHVSSPLLLIILGGAASHTAGAIHNDSFFVSQGGFRNGIQRGKQIQNMNTK